MQQVGGNHYETMDIQPWEVIESCLSEEQVKGYHVATALAYLMRHHKKGGDTDLRKAAHHLERLVEYMGESTEELEPLFNPMDDEQAPEMPKEVADIADIAEMLRKLTGADVSVRAFRIKKPESSPETSCDGGCARCSASCKGA